ncbi:hypothetical protein LCGC14_2318140 [marine sediment metagenome]|uniref:Nucleoside 2-deoxyribosyltransferase n=1 Tax=marine sediment metagenome TaxID=412755 RepID=A0A0F9CJ67_9ZZZZ
MCERRLRVYIAGPMTNGTGRNFNMEKIHEAIDAYFVLIDGGLVPHCPQLTVFCEFMKPNRISYEQWMKLDAAYIDDSDVVLRIPGPSAGADKECKYALSRGKPVVVGLDNFLCWYDSTGMRQHPFVEAPNETTVANSVT